MSKLRSSSVHNMKAQIVSYRRSRNTQKQNQMIVEVEGVNTRKKAESFLEKTFVFVTATKKEIKSKAVNLHGNSGALRVLFERGMPGQSLGKEVKIL